MKFSKFLILLVALFSVNSLATLGEKESSVENVRSSMRGTRKIVAHSLYQIHEITSATRVVREYVSNDGVVFAVTWSGMAHPDFATLFGSYFSEYEDASNKSGHKKGRSPRKVKSQNIVVEKSGHMRNVLGKAYIPSLVPAGVNVDDL